MAERVLPAPDVFATCPLDGKILEYYAGPFEAVYISLHPFIKTVSIEKEEFKPCTYPSRSTIVKNCAPVSWAEVAYRAGLPSLGAVDIGLRTLILGLREEFSNREYAGKIEALFDAEGILPPPEGFFSDLLHDSILQSIQDLGYEWVWVGDEFCTERKLYWIDDLKGVDTGPTRMRCRCNVFTPDKQLLWTTHWDSHFSFLCSSHSNLVAVRDASHLEGFFCSASTEVYWSVVH
jgi:hypothetical protein